MFLECNVYDFQLHMLHVCTQFENVHFTFINNDNYLSDDDFTRHETRHIPLVKNMHCNRLRKEKLDTE